MKKIGHYSGLGVAVVVAVTAMSACTPAESDSADGKDAGKPDMSVDAGKLVKDFEGNELAADKMYNGKTLEVTGVVDKIDTDILDDSEYILQLSHGERFVMWTVNVSGLSEQELAKVGKGDKVTVVGEFDDGGDMGVELENGRLA